eukprot:585391-Lingulodinium_polyedra.AAC.1
MMSRSREWRHDTPIVVLNGDVQRAFDNMTHELMANAMYAAGHHPQLVHAVVAENSFCTLVAEFEGVSSGSIPFNKCARQGGVESSYVWNCVIYNCMSDLVKIWHECGYGIQL